MAAAFEVYNERGYGLAEEIYQECLEIELELRSIAFHSKAQIKCFYKGRELKKRYVPASSSRSSSAKPVRDRLACSTRRGEWIRFQLLAFIAKISGFMAGRGGRGGGCGCGARHEWGSWGRGC